MPGLVGWLGNLDIPLTYPAVLAALRAEGSPGAVEVQGVAFGRVSLLYQQDRPICYGSMSDPETNTAVAFWGEFYDLEFEHCYRNVTRGGGAGGEICRTLLERLGGQPTETLGAIDGSFVIFLRLGSRSFLFADRTASRPLYYLESQNGVIFGPELKTFAHLRSGRPALHRNAMVSFVVNGFPLLDETYYRGVRLLRPGCFLEVQGERVAKGSYTEYCPASPATLDRGIGAYQEELASLLRSAIRKRSRDISGAIFPISGGYDSRGILGCVRENYSGPIATVSWGTDESNPSADAAIGRRVSQYFGTNHRFMARDAGYLIEGLELGVHSNDAANSDSFIHPYEPRIIRSLKETGHSVLFRGDECFGYKGPAVSAMEALARVGIYGLIHYPGVAGLIQASMLTQIMSEQTQSYDEVVRSCPYRGDWDMTKDWLYLNQRLFRNLNFSHYNKLAILEARNPWFDRDILQFYAGIPVSYRYDKCLYRSTLRFMFPDLMSKVPIATRGSLESWDDLLRSNSTFLNYARRHLAEETGPIHEIWRPEALTALLTDYESGASNDPLHVRAIGAIKPVLRKYLSPIYRLAKRRSPSSIAVRSMPARDIIGRLLILKRWCDLWA